MEPFFKEYFRIYRESKLLKNVEWQHRDADLLILNRYQKDNLQQWYSGISVIASTSTHEGFHYAVAQGMLTGCEPLVFNWSTAKDFYDPWVVDSMEQATLRLKMWTPNKDPFLYANYIRRRHSPYFIASELIKKISK